MSNPTSADIWQTLSKIDVSDHIEKKNGLSYLSWAWAWGILMENYPDATYEFLEPESHANGSMTVFCQVTINKTTRLMWLPVMDFRNKAIHNPDSCAINKAKMRCLVKCLALFGLGHYIYAGEDTTDVKDEAPKPITQPQVDSFDSLYDALEEEAPKLITQPQVDSLYEALEESDSDINKFLKAFNKNALEEFTEPEYVRALQMIEMKKEKANAQV